ncbi:NADase-type glycan-binding domain-containing protein [Micromonospora haikouensis]|uniref:NADase-type glycan-binding domain-containing protein n=1 Tax=Micromonospora haikouensis TaxID=686309 RepID=UPI00378FE002
MIICGNCGATNAGDRELCANCHEYLRDDDTPPPRPDLVPRLQVDESRTETAVTDGSPRPVADRPTRADEQGPAPVQPGPPPVVVERPAPGPDPVEPVDPMPPPPEPDRSCPGCGTANRPGRRLCVACGRPLDAPVAPEPERTWWQRLRDRWERLWDRLRGRTPRRRARPDRRALSAARRLLLIVLGLCLVGVLAVVGPPLARRAVEAVRDRTQDPTSLVPTTVTASSERTGAGAERLTDGASNRHWAPDGPAVGAWVESRFTEPVRLLTVIVTPGVGPRRQEFLASGRPRELTVVTVDADGGRRETGIELRDEPGEQHFDVEAADVVRVRLVVRSTYGVGLVPSVAIAEAEFFGRR